jgi:hypothetical protein
VIVRNIVGRVCALFSSAPLPKSGPSLLGYPILFFVVLANIPYWCATQMLTLRLGGWFCIQYLTVGLLALLLPAWAAAIIFFLTASADLVSATCITYSLSLKDCVENADNYVALSAPRQIAVVLVAGLLLLSALIVYKMDLRRLDLGFKWRIAGVLTLTMVLMLLVDMRTIARSTGVTPNPFSMHAESDGVNFASLSDQSRMVRIPVLRLTRQWISEAQRRSSMYAGTALPTENASSRGLKAAGIGQGHSSNALPNFVLILVESWGHPQTPAMENALVAAYQQPELLLHYRIERGTTRFHGTTVAGESRELCGREFGYTLIDEPAQQLQGCLPDRLARLGYHSMALHGLGGAMFRREHWYQTIGFEEQFFHEDFARKGLPDCVGAFTGTCDTAIAGWLGDQLEHPHAAPLFVHWVTLNQHLPLPVPVAGAAPDMCSTALGLQPGTALCSWFQLQSALHNSIATTADRASGQPTVFVIVGDHAPPFVDEPTRARFSGDEVPYVLLIPKLLARSPDRTLVHATSPERPAHRTAQRFTP